MLKYYSLFRFQSSKIHRKKNEKEKLWNLYNVYLHVQHLNVPHIATGHPNKFSLWNWVFYKFAFLFFLSWCSVSVFHLPFSSYLSHFSFYCKTMVRYNEIYSLAISKHSWCHKCQQISEAFRKIEMKKRKLFAFIKWFWLWLKPVNQMKWKYQTQNFGIFRWRFQYFLIQYN